jgi:hypothetical protein
MRYYTAMRPKLVPELICSDLDQSLQFYLGLLGFRILPWVNGPASSLARTNPRKNLITSKIDDHK